MEHYAERNPMILQTAQNHGETPGVVRAEIHSALQMARQNEDPQARAFWCSLPENISDDEVIVRLVSRLLQTRRL